MICFHTRLRTGLLAGLVWAVMWHACSALAAQCALSVQGVGFGNYDTFATSSLDSTGDISISCDISTAYRISLSPGTGSFNARTMQNGTSSLYYNLYVDFGRTTIWGDGTSGTETVSGSTAGTTHVNVFGRVPARQNISVGSYSDMLTVLLEF